VAPSNKALRLPRRRSLVGTRPGCPCLHLRRASQLKAGVGRALEPLSVHEDDAGPDQRPGLNAMGAGVTIAHGHVR